MKTLLLAAIVLLAPSLSRAAEGETRFAVSGPLDLVVHPDHAGRLL